MEEHPADIEVETRGAPVVLGARGWAGIASSTIAFDTVGAMVVNGEARRQILPLGRPLLQPAAPPAPMPAVVERPGW
jgi:hypothetical protein